MTTPEPQTVHKADAILRRVQKVLEYATVALALPAALFHYGRLPHEGWVFVALFGSMALWLGVEIVIATGQRFGLVGTKLFAKSADSPVDGLAAGSRCEAVRVLRTAEDATPPSSRVTAGKPARIVHVPGKGAVAYRIERADEARR